MSDVEVLFDGKTVNSSGSETTDSVDVTNESAVSLYVDGDSNSDDLDIVAQAKVRDVDSDSWAEMDTSIDSENLTNTNNNAKVFHYDVENDALVRYKINNDGASNTDLTVVHSVEQ